METRFPPAASSNPNLHECEKSCHGHIHVCMYVSACNSKSYVGLQNCVCMQKREKREEEEKTFTDATSNFHFEHCWQAC